MPAILVPVGLLASNPWVVIFFVIVALYCILIYFLEYLEKKFSPGHRGTSLFVFWLLIAFVFFILLMLFQTIIVAAILMDLLLIPIIILVALPAKRENSGSLENKRYVVRVLLGAGAVILVLLVSINSTDGFGLISGMGIGTGPATGFEMRIADSAGVPHKIMGASGINASASKVVSDNGNWSVYLSFTDEGAKEYQDAMYGGVAQKPDEHPLSLIVNNETIISRALTWVDANIAKNQRLNAVTIFIGSGADGQEKATRILDSLN